MLKFFFATVFFLGTIANTLSAYELSIAAIFQNEGPFLQEWIEYHRMVGVEHFWLYNDKSTDNWKEILQPYIEEKIVEVIDWPSQDFAHHEKNQVNAYKDALIKSTGATKWLALIDIDEYILPAGERTVTECLSKHFAHAAGVYINWRNFGTGGVYLQAGKSMLFRLTACSDNYHPENGTGKSIVRPECTRPDDVWNAHQFVLKPDVYYYNGDAQRLKFSELGLNLDMKVHNKFLRINHYTMHDENFFHNTKLVRIRGGGREESLILAHYHQFNKEQDTAIINFIREKHPKMYKKYWKSRVPPKGHKPWRKSTAGNIKQVVTK